jgi:hypothetical protein
MLPMSRGEYCTYGFVEIIDLGPRTEIIEFSVTRIPSRLVAGIIPIPEEIYVLVRYRNEDRVEHVWDQTYVLACDTKGACETTNVICGIGLYGTQGIMMPYRWMYFLDVNCQQKFAVPGPPPPSVTNPKPPLEPFNPRGPQTLRV